MQKEAALAYAALFGVSAAADHFRVSTMTIYRWRKAAEEGK